MTMNRPTRRFGLASLLLSAALMLPTGAFAGPRALFDNTHAQTAGNADWTVTGGFSDMGDLLKSLGFTVVSHDKGPITSNDLAGVNLLVLSEPNSVYASSEQQAIVNWVKAGGGLFAIADHIGSDRNHDGIDSVGVLNQFLPQLGAKIDVRNLSEAPVSGKYDAASPICEGVQRVGTWSGTSVSLVNPQNGSVPIQFGPKVGGGGWLALCTAGSGRVVAVGDSSPFDDGTGAPGNHLHDGWNAKGYQHAQLTKNIVRYLVNEQRIGRRDRDSVRLMDKK